MFAGFGENRKTESEIEQIGSEHLKIGSNDFLEIGYINTFLHVF